MTRNNKKFLDVNRFFRFYDSNRGKSSLTESFSSVWAHNSEPTPNNKPTKLEILFPSGLISVLHEVLSLLVSKM